MMPLGDDDCAKSTAPSTPMGSTASPSSRAGRAAYRLPPTRRRSSLTSTSTSASMADVSKRHVQFSESALETTQRTSVTHHPTPLDAKQVVHNTSSRRLAIDEVELYFSEPTRFPPATDDFVAQKFHKRNEVIVGSAMDMKEQNAIGVWRWKTYWVELYNGVMMFHKVKDAIDRDPKKLFITGCKLRIVDLREGVLEIQHLYQQKMSIKLVRCPTKQDLFLWWWALQLASVHKAIQTKPTFMSPLQLVDISNKVENVLYPRPTRGMSSKHTERPSVTHILLVRHGEAENMHFRVADKEKGLTRRGREQAAFTANHIANMLKNAGADESNVQLAFGGLQRTFETAQEFERAMPWLKHTNECCLLEEGAPPSIEHPHRMDFRAAMQLTAYETLCRFDPSEPQRLNSSNTMENFKILICHTSFVQHCIAQTNHIPKDVVKIGAPIGHCSITQIDVYKDINKAEHMEVAYSNRVQHLKLTHRTSE
jgi:hypothetical protein